MPKANGSVIIEDVSGETGRSNVNLQDLDPTGTNYGSVTQDLDEIKDGILAVILGEVRHTNLAVKFPESAAAVSDVNAHRELKWLVTYLDNTPFLGAGSTVANPGYGQPFDFTIPTPDTSLCVPGSDQVDLTDAAWVAFIAAVEPNIRSPYNRAVAATVTAVNEIISVELVGHNL